MTIRHIIRYDNGEELVLFEMSDGKFACPICGCLWPYPPVSPVNNASDVSCQSLGDICRVCKVEFGYDEGCAPYAPLGWMRRQHAELRTRWLDTGGWSKEQLAQLETNLGITEAQARTDAQRLKAGEWQL